MTSPEIIVAQDLSKFNLNGFRGVPLDRAATLVAPMPTDRRGSGLRVIGDTTPVNGYMGHLSVYDTLLPDDVSVSLVPANTYFAKERTANRQVLQSADVLMLYGGQHLGPAITGVERTDDGNERFGGYVPERDLLDLHLAELALKDPELKETVFPLLVCRGSQVGPLAMLQMPPTNVSSHHLPSPSKDSTSFVKHKVYSVLDDMIGGVVPYPAVPKMREVNSYHAQGYQYSMVEQRMPHLRKLGWHPAWISDIDQTVELWVRVAINGRIKGIMTQFHPERMEGEDGKTMRGWIKDCLTAHQAALAT